MNKVLQTNPGVTVNTANTNLLIKNLLAEIRHFNIPKNTRTCLVKQDQAGAIAHQPGPQGGQGAGRRRPEPGARERRQGRGRQGQWLNVTAQ